MKIVKQNHEIISDTNPMKHIEKIARVCYKSEDKICDGSDKRMIATLFKNGHMAMLEHFRFIMQVNKTIYECIEQINPEYFEYTYDTTSHRYLVSCNARALINMKPKFGGEISEHMCKFVKDELIGHIVKEYGCYELFNIEDGNQPILSTPVNFIENKRTCMTGHEFTKHGWMSCKFTTDRGVTHELVRHRKASFAQESTRYCNYAKDKFGEEITVVKPPFMSADRLDKKIVSKLEKEWEKGIKESEKAYFMLLKLGAKPQEARYVLPTSVKADIVVTTNVEEWLHIFELRSLGTTGKPHPMMKELMGKLLEEIVFDWYIKGNKDGLNIGGDWLYE